MEALVSEDVRVRCTGDDDVQRLAVLLRRVLHVPGGSVSYSLPGAGHSHRASVRRSGVGQTTQRSPLPLTVLVPQPQHDGCQPRCLVGGATGSPALLARVGSIRLGRPLRWWHRARREGDETLLDPGG